MHMALTRLANARPSSQGASQRVTARARRCTRAHAIHTFSLNPCRRGTALSTAKPAGARRRTQMHQVHAIPTFSLNPCHHGTAPSAARCSRCLLPAARNYRVLGHSTKPGAAPSAARLQVHDVAWCPIFCTRLHGSCHSRFANASRWSSVNLVADLQWLHGSPGCTTAAARLPIRAGLLLLLSRRSTAVSQASAS